MLKRIGKILGAFALAVVIFIATNGAITFFSAYSPKEEQCVGVLSPEDVSGISGNKVRVLCFNTGHASLGSESDLKEEGGSGKRADTDTVLKNVRGIAELVNLSNADAVLLQSVDIDSHRSRYVDQYSYYLNNGSYVSAFAYDHMSRSTSLLLPYKKVNSGVLTLAKKEMVCAKRVSLPFLHRGVSPSRPRRCMLVTEMSIENSDKKLVLINFELDAYLSDEAKKQQTDAVFAYAQKAYENGNYVIAGGSFYRAFDETKERYPLWDKLGWEPSDMSFDELPEGFTLCYDPAVPTARILCAPYDSASDERQVYVADGYILSKNLSVNMIVTVDQEFRYSSHNPVLLEVKLG